MYVCMYVYVCASCVQGETFDVAVTAQAEFAGQNFFIRLRTMEWYSVAETGIDHEGWGILRYTGAPEVDPTSSPTTCTGVCNARGVPCLPCTSSARWPYSGIDVMLSVLRCVGVFSGGAVFGAELPVCHLPTRTGKSCCGCRHSRRLSLGNPRRQRVCWDCRCCSDVLPQNLTCAPVDVLRNQNATDPPPEMPNVRVARVVAQAS